MGDTQIRKLLDAATRFWEKHRHISTKDRLEEYFKYNDSQKAQTPHGV